MPRVTLRRAFLYFSAVASLSLLLVAVHSPTKSFLPLTGVRRPSGFPDRPMLVVEEQQQAGGLGGAVESRHQLHYNDVQQSKEKVAAVVDSPTKNDVDSSDFARLFIKEEPTAALPANHTPLLPHQRPWFMKEGKRLPQPSLPGHRTLLLWPNEDSGDRIPAQLMYKPPDPPPQYADHPDIGGDSDRAQPALKKILMYNGMNSWGMKAGRGHFMKLKCPVDTCVLTGSRSEISSSDAVVFKDHFSDPHHARDPNQVWIMYMLECPLHTQHFSQPNVFNWTATYRHDSDLVAPYERYMYHDPLIKQRNQTTNYAAGKTKQVAWFVSNCGARNNRLQYAKELGRYIGVDIYGACGTKRCPRSSSTRCFDMLNRDYKFYLAFENSNCRDYITEKFFVNGLSHHILPIVMGAHPDDYARAAPYKSYIHVDDFESPKALADYLHLLDQNDDLYNQYFRWKGTGEFINTYFMCRLCAILHDESHVQHYEDLNRWWRGEGTCISGSWRTYEKMKKEKARRKVTAAAKASHSEAGASPESQDHLTENRDKDGSETTKKDRRQFNDVIN